MRTLKDIGEFGFIKRFSEHFLHHLPEGFEGIGDDCAIMPYCSDEVLLFTTDMLVEDQHFLIEKIKPFELGYKALAVNLSDIAAMGGVPVGAFLSIGTRENTPLDWLDDFFKGLKQLADKTGTLLLGGDTTKVIDSVTINIAVIGKCAKARVKRRSAANVGDYICVTGYLGNSGGGLTAIKNKLAKNGDISYLIQIHNQPEPHLNEGQLLSSYKGVSAMIDVSDGIGSDILHIMEQSRTGAKIYLEMLPVSDELVRTGKSNQWDIPEMAFKSGEDYCLLATIDKKEYPVIKKEFEKAFDRSLYIIGEITNSMKLEVFHNGQLTRGYTQGFDHFKDL